MDGPNLQLPIGCTLRSYYCDVKYLSGIIIFPINGCVVIYFCKYMVVTTFVWLKLGMWEIVSWKINYMEICKCF